MLGVMYYSLFIVLGILCSGRIFRGKSIYFRLWTGGIIGSVVLMAGIIPLALLFGFTRTAHAILAAIFACVSIAAGRKADMHVQKPNVPAAVAAAFFTLLTCVLLTNHVMMPVSGGIASGQSTYGDLAMHMGFITSIAEQKLFPPQYNLLAGTRLCYPFLFDSLSSSLYLFGTDLRTAILYPSFVFAFLIVSGFYFLAKKITKSSESAVLAIVLFFLGGGFGFAYFLDGAKADPGNFTRIFTEFYQTPTNYNENNIRWANAICDMIIPQRTTMAGWSVLIFALWLLADAAESGKTPRYAMTGIAAGCMPMIHTHSFLALGIISAACFFAFLPVTENKKIYVKNWFVYGAIAVGMAAGQLVFWTFHQSVGNDGFLRFSVGWVNNNDPAVWFWLKNCGIIAITAVPAYLAANTFAKRFCAGGIAVFMIADIIIFQPNDYDNNKLFFVTYMLAVILSADFLLMIYRKLKDIGGIKLLASVVMCFSVLSGVLTIAREYVSGGEYLTFSDADIEFAEFVKNNTPATSVFASGSQHLNPVSTLAGRNIYAGSESYVYYHGLGDEMIMRRGMLRVIYEGGNAAQTAQMCGIDYILVTDEERAEYDIDFADVESLEKVYGKNRIELYKISKKD